MFDKLRFFFRAYKLLTNRDVQVKFMIARTPPSGILAPKRKNIPSLEAALSYAAIEGDKIFQVLQSAKTNPHGYTSLHCRILRAEFENGEWVKKLEI